jgi:succinate-acetate transporter protein
MVLGGFLEFILGNTFPFVVFLSFGAFWLSFAGTLTPFYNTYGAYSTTSVPADGIATVGFTSSFAFFLVFMGVLCFIYLICSLRTNVCFVVIFLTLTIAFSLLAATYWTNAEAIAMAGSNPGRSAAKVAMAGRMQIAAGACVFVTSLSGWWIFFAIMLAALDFPFQIPVGDLSTMIRGYSEKSKV